MTPASVRSSRQLRLSEVGETGQASIESAEYRVRGAESAGVERTYLERAGARRILDLPDAAPEPFSHAPWFHFDAPGVVGAGAWRALESLRAALGIGRS